MKSFKEHLEESWKKGRLRRKLNDNQLSKKIGNQRVNRLRRAYENEYSRNSSEDESKTEKLRSLHDLTSDNYYTRRALRGAKLRGKAAEFGKDPDEDDRNFSEFNKNAKMRGAFGLAVSAENQSKRETRYRNVIDDALWEWPTRFNDGVNRAKIISKIKYLKRTAPEQKRLGIKGPWPWDRSASDA